MVPGVVEDQEDEVASEEGVAGEEGEGSRASMRMGDREAMEDRGSSLPLCCVFLIYGFDKRSHKWLEGSLAFVDIKSGSQHQTFCAQRPLICIGAEGAI